MVGVAGGHDLWASGPAARRVIEGNRKRDTLPEIAIRRPPYARGLRYRIAGRPLADRPSTANLVFCGSWYSLTVPTDMGSRSAARAREPTTGTGAAGSNGIVCGTFRRTWSCRRLDGPHFASGSTSRRVGRLRRSSTLQVLQDGA